MHNCSIYMISKFKYKRMKFYPCKMNLPYRINIQAFWNCLSKLI